MLTYRIEKATKARTVAVVNFFEGGCFRGRVFMYGTARAIMMERDFAVADEGRSVFREDEAADATALLSVLRDELIDLGVITEQTRDFSIPF
jgi:hypothetical protein